MGRLRREVPLLLDATPDLLGLHRLDPLRYPCLLESVGGGTSTARFDILFASTGEHLTLRHGGRLHAHGITPAAPGFIDSLDAWWRSLAGVSGEEEAALPFHGGWFLFLAYELVGEIEPRLAPLLTADEAVPVAKAIRCPGALIHDRLTARTWAVAESGTPGLLEAMQADAARVAARGPREDESLAGDLRGLEEEDPQRFIEGVGRIRRHIEDGDVFQVNLSRGWSGRLDPGVSDAAVYRRLRSRNPAPFSALARLDGLGLISSSPERLVSVRAGVIETRPIAGTRPRGADPASDRELMRRLLEHPKERAEHIMLIDLERNDLGRVCRPGSVRVDELMTVESYAHVHHIVSNVRGRLRDAVTPGEVMRAVFPGGTITGCPKVRCMEIIASLEGVPRAAYTGSVGYLGRDGAMDLNILIRTLVRNGEHVSLRAGAGIVADSVAAKELDETRAKAEGLLRVFRA